MFFLILSMSRWTATYMRRVPYITRFVNWDLSQEFHIKMSICALVLATGHMIGHLSGTFNTGSKAGRQDAVGELLGPEAVPRSYTDYLSSRPGWTGFTAIGCFYLLALMSMPQIRKKSYELFQLGHLLMYPMIAMLMAHGTLGLLQYPVMGFVLAFPTLMVVLERGTRFLLQFHKVPASLEVLDDDTVCITATIPRFRLWKYKAGQYVFLQVPQLSFWQWHPFTVSECIGKEFKLHIKTDGDWTSQLRSLKDLTHIGVDGPYGAPAQRFYDFDQTIIVGSGIGVTPFSGILNDLQTREDHAWTQRRDSTSSHESKSTVEPRQPQIARQPTIVGDNKEIDLNLYRRVDFHWIIRDRAYINWFSTLLNKISTGEHNPNLDIRLHNHVTKKRKDIQTHVYRWLLEKHRTKDHPASPLTGLLAPTHFGRPDFPRIFTQHYDDMLKLFAKDKQRKRRVGVFFCGAPIIGQQLADLCHEMTLRGRHDGSEIEYFFQIEVFG
jgi:dual oxidase